MSISRHVTCHCCSDIDTAYLSNGVLIVGDIEDDCCCSSLYGVFRLEKQWRVIIDITDIMTQMCTNAGDVQTIYQYSKCSDCHDLTKRHIMTLMWQCDTF